MNKRPLFLAAAFFLLGILSARLWNVWIFLLSAIFLACHSYLRWKKRGSVQGIVYAVTFSVIFVLGICHMQNAIKSHQAVESLLEDGEKAAVWGTVSKKEEGAKSTKIYLKHCNLRVEEKQLPCRQILVYLNTDVSVGNIIYVNGTVKTLEPARNEGNFDEKKVREQTLNSMERTCSLSAVIQIGLQNFSIRKNVRSYSFIKKRWEQKPQEC